MGYNGINIWNLLWMFCLTKIGARPGVKFSEVVKEAKEKGFTELLPE